MKKNDSISCWFVGVTSLPFSLITFNLMLIMADLVWCTLPSSELMWFVHIVKCKWAWQDSLLDTPEHIYMVFYICCYRGQGLKIDNIGIASYEVKGFGTSQLGLESVLLRVSIKGLENKYEAEMTVSRNKLMIIWIRKGKNDRRTDKFILEEWVMTGGKTECFEMWWFHFSL